MNCTIEWNSLDPAGWEARFSAIRRSTLPQSYDYARAVCPLYGQRGQWGLIRIGGAEAGLVQMLEARLFGRALHALAIDRGPLWFPGFGGVMHLRAVLDELNRLFPARFGRRRRLIPEIVKSPTASGLLQQAGWTARGPDYTTLWLDLTRPPEELRSNLKSNWRGCLNKTERGPLSLRWDTQGAAIDTLVSGYVADRQVKSYPGPAPKVIRALARQFSAGGKALIGQALLDNRVVSSILILCHGCAATYQVGWNDAEGRRHGGHYALLWDGFAQLQKRGIMDLDLGGVNDDSAQGVSGFKDGTGGQRVTLAGLYT